MKISDSAKGLLTILGLEQLFAADLTKSEGLASDTDIVVRVDGETLHCEDGPAIILPGEMEAWLIEGSFHRVGGPAILTADGLEIWCENGRIHRVGGPAVIFPDGTGSWWENGRFLEEETVASAWRSGQSILKLEM